MSILVITTEPLPWPGCSTTGAGLRAWGLAQGLLARGFDVAVASPAEQSFDPGAVPADARLPRRLAFRRPDGLVPLLLGERPEVVVLQHWGMASEVPELTVPLVLDLAGPHLLERLFWGDADRDRSLLEKLAALRRADFLTCSGWLQRLYFLPYLAQAGWDLRRPDLLPVIPFCVGPEMIRPHEEPFPRPAAEPTFVYGGAFLAWQDPSLPLRWLLEEMDNAGRGRLLFYGGNHPQFDASAGRFDAVIQMLSGHRRVEMRDFRPLDQLLDDYRREGTVALDLMARNPERELAYTTRTVVYLACGLPVLYNNYSELSGVIRQHRAGWTLDPQDEVSFREAVRSVLNGTAPLEEMSQGALAAAREHDWTRTIAPLADFCARPAFRVEKTAAVLAWEAKTREIATLRSELQIADSALKTIQGKFLFRLQRRLPKRTAILAPLAWVASLPLAGYIYLKLRGSARK